VRIFFIASSASFLLGACASSTSSGPPPVEVKSTGTPGEAAATRSQRMTATVLAVDTASRKLTLKGEDGHSETIAVAPEVRLSELSAGDAITVELQEGLLLEYQPPGSAFVSPAALVAGGRTIAGAPPAGAAMAAVQSTVTIIAVNLDSRIVQFQDPDGNKYQVKAGPGLSIEKLTVGDRLVATYAAALAITVDKAAKP